MIIDGENDGSTHPRHGGGILTLVGAGTRCRWSFESRFVSGGGSCSRILLGFRGMLQRGLMDFEAVWRRLFCC